MTIIKEYSGIVTNQHQQQDQIPQLIFGYLLVLLYPDTQNTKSMKDQT